MGWQTFISFMAFNECKSWNFKFANSMLDGGHLVYYIIEAIRGKPVSEQIQMFGLKLVWYCSVV